MGKTRKRGKQKQVIIKHKSKRLGPKRLGKGPEDKLPYLLREKLNDVSERTYNKQFYEPRLVSHILQDVPRASVTEALQNAPYKKEVTRLLSQKFKQSATSRAIANSQAIANKIVNAVPTTHITIGRKKQALTNELIIAQAALDAYIAESQPIHARKEELYNKLGVLEDKHTELEEAIGYSNLDKYDDLKIKYYQLKSSDSMLDHSRASIIKLRLKAFPYTRIGRQLTKLRALEDKIYVATRMYDEANAHSIAEYEEDDRLTQIVSNLKTQLEDLEDL
jgi:hypothetical protein